jgi:7,8-dihydropterin-6-yl-methyl-4-(beta-D-ribofuranosyl)aminobenzene 5'-phosphate synthase
MTAGKGYIVTTRFPLLILGLLCLLAAGCSTTQAPPEKSDLTSPARITVLYDAFGKPSAMKKDWGYAALIEYQGKRILFDTGNDAGVLEQNAKASGVDLSRLDFVVMSHRHGDHMGGMSYLLRVNPKVAIYAPKEGFGIYGADLPSSFYRKDEALPPEQRYFDGAPPEVMRFGSAWPSAHFTLIAQDTEIAPGIHLIALVSDKPGTLELRELSLAIETPAGMVLVVGCAHPGIDRIVAAAARIDNRILLVAGGLHLVVAQDPEIERIVRALHDTYQVGFIAPGHCTGEATFKALLRAFGERNIYAGLGTRIAFGELPHASRMSARLDADDLLSYRKLAREYDEEYLHVAHRE